jgi:hypothetical protein
MSQYTANTQLTIYEVAKRHVDGDAVAIAEILARDNEILTDAVWIEANQQFAHVTTQRYALAAGSWRTINAGVAAEATQTKQITDTLGMLETYSEVDCKLVDVAANPAQFRNDEDAGFLEGLSQTLATTVMYGNALTTPTKFTGFAPRVASLTTNVLGCSGTGSDLTSMFLVQWGADKVHMIYPKGSAAGITKQDLGEVTKVDSSGYMWQVYRTHFKLEAGLVVRNPRCIGRVCNIETAGSSNLFDEDQLIKVMARMYMGGRGAVLYCNATLWAQIQILAKDKSNVFYTASDAFGTDVLMFRGCPIRRVDAILDTESALT